MSSDVSRWRIAEGDCLSVLPTLEAGSVQTCITSPPYWGLRDYGHGDQLGLESTPEEYVERMVGVFRDVRRVLRDDGTLWLNLGDSYNGSGSVGGEGKQHTNQGSVERPDNRSGWSGLKPKDLVGIPWRVAFALQADGWYLRSDIIWAKPNPMPESVTDRPTKAHEYLFLLSKRERYYYDAEAIREPDGGSPSGNGFVGRQGGSERYGAALASMGSPGTREEWLPGSGRNRRTVWTIPTQPFPGAHFAVMPPALVEPCVLAGAPEDRLVLDPFAGAGTVGVVCRKHRRRFLGIELNPDYARMARGRLGEDVTADLPEEQATLFHAGM
jgi:DNA modification methylase